MRVLFLCTGNYFRSRFSQALFQQLIEINQATGRLQVDSAGLKVDPNSGNVGPMAPEAISALQDRGVTVDPASLAAPKQVTEADLDAADVVVAVDEAAHRPMVQQQFPAWEDRIRFWTVKDLDEEDGVDPIAQLEHRVQQLFDELKPE